jgi:predicted ArsR family transcriptional regulator
VTTERGDAATPTLPAGRRAVLYAVRRRGEATAEQVAEQLDMTVSGARQHLSALAADGLVEATETPPPTPRRGRKALVRRVPPPPTHCSPRRTASSRTSCSAT